jgi:uncharacterized protein YrrD
MYKGKHIIGKSIITRDSGEIIDRVEDVLFDSQNNKILGFLVDEGGMLKSARVLPYENILIIGADGITIHDRSAIVDAKSVKEIQEFIPSNNILLGTKVMTEDGKNLGKITDVYFDEIMGTVEGYEVSGGMFADAMSGTSFLPSPKTINIGRDVAFVPSDVITLMDMQKEEGGIRKLMRETTDKVRSSTQSVQSSVSSGYYNARDTMQEKATNMRNDISARMPEKKEVNTKINNGMDSFESGVSTAWTRIKEKATHMREKLYSEREEQQIKSALGRPVTRVILDKQDNVILKTGDIVTHDAIEKARHAQVLDVLVTSVYKDQPGFSSDELKERGSKDTY